MLIKCKGCENSIKTTLSAIRWKSGKSYCSPECYTRNHRISKKCPICKKVVSRERCRAIKRTYCSEKCCGIAMRKHPVIDFNGISYYKTTGGYYVSRPAGKHGVMLHRAIYETVHKVKLRKIHTVHHKDGNRENNAQDNLELWVGNHGKGCRLSDLIPQQSPSTFTP